MDTNGSESFDDDSVDLLESDHENEDTLQASDVLLRSFIDKFEEQVVLWNVEED